MTTALKTEIQSGPLAGELAPYVTSGNDTQVAAILNEQRGETMLRERMINARGVLAYYPGGPLEAATVLDKLEAAAALVPAVKWVMTFLKTDGIDIGMPSTHAMLDQLAAGGLITVDEADKLKSLGYSPASRAEIVVGRSVSANDVARAIRNDDGSSKL